MIVLFRTSHRICVGAIYSVHEYSVGLSLGRLKASLVADLIVYIRSHQLIVSLQCVSILVKTAVDAIQKESVGNLGARVSKQYAVTASASLCKYLVDINIRERQVRKHVPESYKLHINY